MLNNLRGLKRFYQEDYQDREHLERNMYIVCIHDIYTNHMYFANHGWLFDDIFLNENQSIWNLCLFTILQSQGLIEVNNPCVQYG